MGLPLSFRFNGIYNFNIADAGTTLTNNNEIILQADTSVSPCTINLPNVNTYFGGQTSFLIKIVDYGNNASVNNITINAAAGNTIDGGANQFVINTDGMIVEFIIVGDNRLSIITTTPVASGANGGTIFKSQLRITSAQILTLHTTPVTIVPAQGAGIVIKPIATLFTLNFNSVGYLTGGASTTFRYGSFDTTVVAWDTAFIANSKSDIYDASTALIASATASGFATYDNQPLQIRASSGITDGNSTVATISYWISLKGP